MRKTHAEINAALDAKMAALGIATASAKLPTVTVYPGERTTERLAHFGADRLIANNPAYDSMSERLDAELREILDGRVGLAAPRAKSTRRERVARVMTND
ncbi:hypothetical protein [Paraburkholderia bryophila]|uniref:Uncharacterized protein n=1 Tax=Paraburkholderia bryophila TaxID=420952 RepID=A0A7Z0B8X3_9BURK|nr:hypothetical protein [Paraburkholderia bryophila]NYH24678.1 hypothetical protein [Paraburkholderia bryophila]